MEIGTKFRLLGVRALAAGATIGVILCIFLICKFFSWMFSPPQPIYVDYQSVKEKDFSSIESFNAGFFNWYFNEEKEPYVIFDEMNSSHSGYKENEEYIYSPLVLIANENVLNINSGFNVSDSEKDIFYRKVEKNLFSILEAIEQGKTWQDIGVNAECLEGPVILGVPDIYSSYRKQVKDLFMLNLTAEDINEQNYEELEQRAEKILEKCQQIENPKAYLTANKGKKIIIIAPEYILENDNDKIFRPLSEKRGDINSQYFTPIYLTRTTALKYSLFIKEDLKEDLKDEILLNLSGSYFTEKTGFRSKGNNSLEVSNCVQGVNIKTVDTKKSTH